MEEKPLRVNRVLLATGFTQMFGDSLNNRFNNLLVASAGASVGQMGFLQGARTLGNNLTQLVFGRLADRWGKRVFVSTGRLLNAAAIAGLLFTREPTTLIALVVLSSFFNSMAIPAWNSLVGDYTEESTRGRVLGAVNSMSQLGSFAAMAVAVALSLGQEGATTVESYRVVLSLAAVACLASGLMVWLTEEKPPAPRKEKLDFRKVAEDHRLTRYLALNFLYGVGMSFAWPLFPMVITHRLGLKLWQIGALSLTSSLVGALTQRGIGRFMDKQGRKPVVIASRVTMAVAPLTYALATQWWHIALGELFLGLGMAAWMSSESTYMIDLAPPGLRATYLASSTAAFGVASFLGSNLGGHIIETYLNGLEGLNTGLYISSLLRALFGLAYLLAHESRTPETN